MSSLPLPCNPNAKLLEALRGMKTARRFRKGATLFDQGSRATGVYLVESGEISMLLTTNGSQRQLVDVAGSGTILGLSESLTAENYRITAMAADETTVVFIPREEFLSFLEGHCEFCMQIVRLLSEDLHGLYHKFRSITAHPGRPRRRPLDEQLN